jgi:lipopolysaccharide/colanic/teichoic acid biosynthesis glycosyltransferase
MTIKRLVDLAIVTVFAPVIVVLLAVVAVLVRVKLGSPVLFVQTRPGLHGRPFRMVKFRSMSDARDTSGALRPDAERLGPFGRFLRASSLDELPEIVNVVAGEMSLVGPRPLLMEYLPLYTAAQARRHDVPPGITGWAQVNGRNALSWEEKFAHDVWYIDNRSLALDLRILATTLRAVATRRGISASGEATMPRFTGSDHREG